MRFSCLIILLVFLLAACTESPKKKRKKERITQDSTIIKLDVKFDSIIDISADHIRLIIESRLPGERYYVLEEELYSTVLLPKFYLDNEFKPAWVVFWDSLQVAQEMLTLIKEAEYHGLQAAHYHRDIIANHLQLLEQDSSKVFDPIFIATLDLLLTDAYFMLASHLYHGKVDPTSLKAEWGIQRNKPELALDQKLRRFLENDSLSYSLRLLYPPHPGYEAMVAKAKKIKPIADNDFQLPTDAIKASIKPGDSSIYIPNIREKLSFLGILPVETQDSSNFYDAATQQGIQRLQAQYGYNTDGVIGRNTFIALNNTVDQQLQQLYVNMERLRWMPDSLEDKYIMVNIADFTLSMLQKGDTIIKMRTVVGRDYRQTPVFNAKMTYLVFSPTWTVPPGIMQNDVIPAVRKNIGYLAGKNMLVLDRNGYVVDPATVDWAKDGMKYTVRQLPGAQNALGRVKFMFPNKHSVYLHDTPSRELFARDERIFSSGCIRIEKPVELARLLLADMPEWTDERMRQAMNESSERTVILRQPVGVYLYYLTAWGDSNGNINFRKDVYSRDEEVYAALLQKKGGDDVH